MDLSKKRCKPCEGGIVPLDQQEVEGYLKQIKDGWKITDNNKISKEFLFVNFKHTMDFVNKQIFTIPFKVQLQLLSVPNTIKIAYSSWVIYLRLFYCNSFPADQDNWV